MRDKPLSSLSFSRSFFGSVICPWDDTLAEYVCAFIGSNITKSKVNVNNFTFCTVNICVNILRCEGAPGDIGAVLHAGEGDVVGADGAEGCLLGGLEVDAEPCDVQNAATSTHHDIVF